MSASTRRGVMLALGASALLCRSPTARAQDIKVPSTADLVAIFSDEHRLNLFRLDIDFVRLVLLRIQFEMSKAKNFSDLSSLMVSKSWEQDRAAYFQQRQRFDNPATVQNVVAALRSSGADKIVQAAGELSRESAGRIAAALAENGIRNKLNGEPVFSLIAFAQAVAVVDQKAESSPPYCNYFPFSRYCKTG